MICHSDELCVQIRSSRFLQIGGYEQLLKIDLSSSHSEISIRRFRLLQKYSLATSLWHDMPVLVKASVNITCKLFSNIIYEFLMFLPYRYAMQIVLQRICSSNNFDHQNTITINSTRETNCAQLI